MDESATGWHEVGYLDRGTRPFLATSTAQDINARVYLNDWKVRESEITVEFRDVDHDALRAMFGIPPGFPLWYVPPRPALAVGPIGRYIQQTQCQCGHDETQHIVVIGECLGGACDCTLLRLPPGERPPRWRVGLSWLARQVFP